MSFTSRVPFSAVGRVFLLVTILMPAAGCQAFFGDDQDNSIGAQRLAASAPVASKQRLGEDGYPLLGAFPGTAAPQLTDAQIADDRTRFNALATQRAAAPDATGYDAAIARASALRQSQAEAGAAEMARKPAPARPTGPTPEQVLKQIEAGT